MLCVLNFHQFIFPAAKADLFAVGQAGLPIHIGVRGLEMVGTVAVCAADDGVRHFRLRQHGVNARLIQGHGVEGGEHPHVRHDRHVVLRVAVAEGRDVDRQADVEVGAAMQHRQRVLRHLAVEDLVGRAVVGRDGVHRADADAAPATDALGVVNRRLARLHLRGVVRADLGAAPAADALGVVDGRLAGRVHLHLARAAAAAHADVLDGPAEAGALVPLEMVERNDDVRVHHRAADLRGLHVAPARHGHLHVVRPLQAVGDEGVDPRDEGVVAVLVGRVEMVEGVLAPADVEGVAVGDEGLAAQFLDQVADRARVVRPQEGQVARLAEVQLHGHEAALEVEAAEAGLQHEFAQFRLQAVTHRHGVHVGEPNIGGLRIHLSLLLVCPAV